MKIPVFKPYLDDAEMDAAVASLKLGWLGPGSYVKEFEESVAAFLSVDASRVVAVNTGASAVHMALELCNVTHGDEVITPSFNNISDFQMIRNLQASPVFCDVFEDTLTINPDSIEGLISPKTKAIICLDYGSALCDYAAVKAIGDRHGIPVIHDAAHAFGSSQGGRKIGSFSDLATFSFDPVKNITCIDGGVVVVQTPEQAQRVQHMRLLGQQQSQSNLNQNKRAWTYDVAGPGHRYHLANLHGAIGLEQMRKIKSIYDNRVRVFDSYAAKLKNMPGLVQPVKNGDSIMPFIYVVRVLNGKRQEFRDYLAAEGVDTGIHWQPGHGFTAFKNYRRGDLRVTDMIGDQIVTLPMYPGLTEEEINYICNVIGNYCKQSKAA